MSSKLAKDLSVGEMAARAGVAVSTLHFYEAEGLIRSWRTPANHRRFDRTELRRVAIIRTAQAVGVPLSDIRTVLDQLPARRITAEDWRQAAALWAERLDQQIATLQQLRGHMGDCIGCGCLSMAHCPLYNLEDRIGAHGAGPRRWVGAAAEAAEMDAMAKNGEADGSN